MFKTFLAMSICAVVCAAGANAQTCGTYPASLSNGTTADANDVNANFAFVLNCANVLAPLNSPSFGGNVGIGTSSPSAEIHVLTAVNDAAYFQNLTGNVNLNLVSGDFVAGTETAYWKLGALGSGGFQIRDSKNGITPFSIAAGATANSLYIASGGNVGIQTGMPAYSFYVNGTSGGTSGWTNTSDARLKTNILPIQGALGIVEKLQGVRFEWRQPGDRTVGKSLNLPLADPQVGFLAQEVRKVLPEAVTVSHDGEAIMSVQETKILPVLVEAVKELSAQNAALKATSDKSIAQIASLRMELGQLRHSLHQRSAAVENSRSRKVEAREAAIKKFADK